MTNTRTPSATVKFYDMQDGAVMTEVDMHGGYKGTPAQTEAAKSYIIDVGIRVSAWVDSKANHS